MAQYINNPELIRRLSSSMGISPLGLVKTEQQIAAEMQAAQQAQMQQELVSAGAANPEQLANAAATVQQLNSTTEEQNG